MQKELPLPKNDSLQERAAQGSDRGKNKSNGSGVGLNWLLDLITLRVFHFWMTARISWLRFHCNTRRLQKYYKESQVYL
jgi:hypothetical protein